MPRKSAGRTGDAWDTCMRCGFIHPIGMLTIQYGRKLCKCHNCLDNIDIDRRQRVVTETLANGEELVSQDPLLHKGSDQEDVSF